MTQETSANEKVFIGVDLGGTNIKVGVVDNQGRTLAFLSTPTLVSQGPEDAMTRMATAIHQAIEKSGVPCSMIAHVGLGSPGTHDIPAGLLIHPSNLKGWDMFPIRDKLAQACGYPVTFANDASSASFAEYWIGNGQQEGGLVLLTLGTGVGCGIVLEGNVWDGVHSHGGESGHCLIDISENARMCNCGHRGHLEAYASATGVAKRTREIIEAGVGAGTSFAQKIQTVERLDQIPKIVWQEAEEGDTLALDIIKDTARYLAYGIVSLIHTLDPSCVLIGGAMTFGGNESSVGRLFLDKIREETYARIFAHLIKHIRIDFAKFGGDAGYLGAAGLARQAWIKETTSK